MASETHTIQKWSIGPPAPWIVTLLARLLELTTFVLVAVWVYNNLGGLGFRPKIVFGPKAGVEANDTSPIFNWHPLLMSLAFPVFMAEAILAYRRPLAKDLDRPQRKYLHAVLHTLAIICIIVAIIATFKSHSLKKPVQIPHLYSPHSYLGMFTFIVSLLQYLVGLGGFLIPQISSSQKAALSPLHVFLGRTTFVLGLATMAVGVQEKTTFMQDGMKLQGPALFRSYLKLPATILLLLALTGIFVLYHHVPGSSVSRAEDDTLLESELQDPEQ